MHCSWRINDTVALKNISFPLSTFPWAQPDEASALLYLIISMANCVLLLTPLLQSHT
jgi:hypothetical protein